MPDFELSHDNDNKGWDFDDSPWSLIIDDIKTIVIEEGVINIGLEAFLGAKSLEEIIIKGIGINIRSAAFAYCKNLKRVFFEHPDAGNAYVKLEEGTFSDCVNLESINLPKNGELENNVFYNCKSLGKVRIPQGTRLIDDYTFSGCENLIEVEVPNTVERIEPNAFEGCDKLKHVALPSSVKKIGIFELN